MLSRRNFLKSTATGAAVATLAPTVANAASTSGYKALVCISLEGGADSHDILIGHDEASYADWSRARQSILANYAETNTPGARARENLLPLEPFNDSVFGGRSFALPPEMSGVKDLFDRGDLSFVANVGPLIEPVDRAMLQSGNVQLPKRLQSHNDQLATWQSMAPEGEALGWGGLMLDVVNETSPYTAVSTGSRSALLAGIRTSEVQITNTDNVPTAYLSNGRAYGSDEIAERIRRWYKTGPSNVDSVLMRDMIRAQASSVDTMQFLRDNAGGQTIGDQVAIEGNALSEDLAVVANLIATRSALDISRQIFYVRLGGFDTHDKQHERLPALLRTLSEAMASFQNALNGAGLANDVTTFTMSDFGRTLTSNASGTDHGWGGHHMVMGGAIQGQMIHGTIPEYAPDNPYDFRRGAMIPTLAVEQYASELGRWFGLSESELDVVFSNRGAFDRFALQLF